MHTRLAVGALATCVAISGCDRATRSDPPPAPAGSLTVALVGESYQLFTASGVVPAPSTGIATFAAALAAPTTAGFFAIGGFRARAGHQDALTLDVRGVDAPGSFAANGILTVGTGTASPTPYTVTATTVQITALSDTRIAGTFDGLALSIAGFGEPVDTLELRAGEFDVPIIRP